jgi:iron complex transport system substrate-binding protein
MPHFVAILRRCSLRAAASGALCVASAWTAAAAPPPVADANLPRVASINLCADQLVLSVAAPEQIRTVSWLAADPEESAMAAEAARFPLNYGGAEELLRFDPDVVIAGAYTNAFTRALLARLGYRIVELEPEKTIAEIEANLQVVAAAVGQPARGAALAEEVAARARALAASRPAHSPATVVVRPGGFTVGRHSLADDLIALAGLRNVAAEQGLDRWGSLSMETLVRSAPELIVVTGYHASQPSLANAVLDHPALRELRSQRRVAHIPTALWACGLPQSLDSVALLQSAVAP